MFTDPIPDVVVLIPGILGSVLQRNGKDVWAISGSGIGKALASGWESIQSLALKGDSDADDLGDQVTAPRMIDDVHLIPWLWKIDGYTRIRRALTTSFQDIQPGKNFFEFPYDWRRDNRVAARRLAKQCQKWLEDRRKTTGNDKAKLILICHSMGGLVARYFIEVLGGWRDTLALITFGTPYRGSLNALDFIANGMKKKFGPVPIIDLSNLLRSFTSVYQLLPIYPCHDEGSGMVRVKDAKKIPNLNVARAESALAFHDEIREAVSVNLRDEAYLQDRYHIHPIVGTRQPTLQSSRFIGKLEMQYDYRNSDMDGDGTVPRVSATPIEIEKEKRETFIAEKHGSLQNASEVWAHLESVLKNSRLDLGLFKAASDLRANNIQLGLSIEDLYVIGESIRPRAYADGQAVELTAELTDVDGLRMLKQVMKPAADGSHETEFPPQPEGVYRIRVSGQEGVCPVQDVLAVSG
jgi:pimeloyl-ACP methyl ester carboxylesterase